MANPYQFSNAERPVSVLVISPNPKVHGGVSTFVEVMKAHLKNCRVTSFWVGSISGEKESASEVVLRFFTSPFRVAWIVARGKFDAVHINPSFNAKSLPRDGFILLLLRLTNYRNVLVYFHGWQRSIENRVKGTPPLRFLTAWLLNGAGRVTVLGPDFKKGLEEMGVDSRKIICTRTMFDGTMLKKADNVPASRRRTILFISRFDRQKGVYELIDAFARLAAEFPDMDLIMAGDGEEMAGVKARAAQHGLSGRSSFPGYVTGDEKWRMLKACAVYALPTYMRSEAMPVALLEAMGAGKPVLAGSAGSISTIISDPENGVYLPAVSTDTVEAGLRRLLSNPQLCEDIGRHNISYAWENFEAAAVTAGIEAMYREIAWETLNPAS
jgi:glycosyltransferase involved in cell wall biosynthesis